MTRYEEEIKKEIRVEIKEALITLTKSLVRASLNSEVLRSFL